jgi:hypothetical protein
MISRMSLLHFVQSVRAVALNRRMSTSVRTLVSEGGVNTPPRQRATTPPSHPRTVRVEYIISQHFRVARPYIKK